MHLGRIAGGETGFQGKGVRFFSPPPHSSPPLFHDLQILPLPPASLTPPNPFGLLTKTPPRQNRSYVDQLNLILSVLGTPDDETLTRVGSEKAGKYIRSLDPSRPVAFETLFPEADEQGAFLSPFCVSCWVSRYAPGLTLCDPSLCFYDDAF